MGTAVITPPCLCAFVRNQKDFEVCERRARQVCCDDLRRNDLSRRHGDTEIKANEIGTAVITPPCLCAFVRNDPDILLCQSSKFRRPASSANGGVREKILQQNLHGPQITPHPAYNSVRVEPTFFVDPEWVIIQGFQSWSFRELGSTSWL